MKNIRISAIIPVYNVEPYLEECLESVLGQSQPFDEIILVNDGSTDGSGEICRRYDSAHPETILIEQENSGLSEARNAAMARATGDYALFIDSDDWISEKTCETLKRTIAQSSKDLDIVFYSGQIIMDMDGSKAPGTILFRYPTSPSHPLDGFESLKKFFPRGCPHSANLLSVRCQFLKDHGITFIRGHIYEDILFFLNVTTEAKRVVCLDDKLYFYRKRPSSITTNSDFAKKADEILFIEKQTWKYLKGSKKWMSDMDFTIKFILYYAIIMVYSDEIFPRDLPDGKATFLTAFFQEWRNVLEERSADQYDENEQLELFYLLQCLKDADGPSSHQLSHSKKAEDFLARYPASLASLAKKKLERLPFNTPGKKIALYGAGTHTKCLLSLYRELIGEVKADLTLLVTSKDYLRPSCGLQSVSLDQATDEFDSYVISSKLYQEEMYANLLEKPVPREKIIRLYDEGELDRQISIIDIYRTLSQ